MKEIIKETRKQIRDLKIQGASNVAKASLLAIYNYAKKEKFKDKDDFYEKILKAGRDLALARPTEPLTQNIMRFLLSEIKNGRDLKKTKRKFLNNCHQMLLRLEKIEKKIARYLSEMVSNGDKIFTHCHSSTVERGLILAKRKNKKFEVFVDETRPLFQGRITAKNLLKNKIPTTLVVDAAADFLISRYSGRDLMMTKIIIGADAILEDGSVINKIGSFGIGLSAFFEKIPLYVSASLLKFTKNSWIKIEKRSPKEIWQDAPKNLKIINFAFDIVPAKFIKGIICEEGIFLPKEIKKIIKKTYPWIFTNFPISLWEENPKKIQ